MKLGFWELHDSELVDIDRRHGKAITLCFEYCRIANNEKLLQKIPMKLQIKVEEISKLNLVEFEEDEPEYVWEGALILDNDEKFEHIIPLAELSSESTQTKSLCLDMVSGQKLELEAKKFTIQCEISSQSSTW